MTESNNHGNGWDWMAVGLVTARAVKHAADPSSIRFSYWMAIPAVALGLGVWGWLLRVGGPFDPFATGAAVASLTILFAPYVHHWAWNAIRRYRGASPTGSKPHGICDDTTARRSTDTTTGRTVG